MNAEVSSPFREVEVRGSVAGRGAQVEVEELRADFASALRSALCEGERVERLFAIRSEQIAKVTFPATLLALTDRALLVLREPPKDIGPSLGIRVAIVSYRSLGAIELGHVALRGSFEFRFGSSEVGAPILKAWDMHGGSIAVPYHTLDEPELVALVRRLRELAEI